MADQATVRDIKMIYSVHSRMDYSNTDQVRVVQEKLIERNVFETDIGIDYLDKLSDIVKKSDMGRCIFCKQMFSAGTAICDACAAKLDNKYGKAKKSSVPAQPVMESEPAIEAAPVMEVAPELGVTSDFETSSELEAAPDMDDIADLEAIDLVAAMEEIAKNESLENPSPMFSEEIIEPDKSVVQNEDGPASFMESLAAMTQNQDASEIIMDAGKKAKKAADKSVRLFAKKVNELAGGEGEVELRFGDFFSDILKKHTSKEAEEIFICGTSMTTPDESQISSMWPKPWLYSRVLLILFAAFYLLILCWTGFKNTNVIPDIIFIGSAIMPITVLIFFFEINAPRNISLITVLKVFFVGGAASLIVTLLLFNISSPDHLDYIGALIVGIIEETGKAVIVAIAIKHTEKCKYIFNGILIGGAVGAGFAAFESAGYAFNVYLRSFGYENAYSNMIHNIYLRGILSPGGHVAWAAITGAAIMIALNRKEFTFDFVKDKRFIALFAMAVIMHGIWDCPLVILGIPLLKLGILVAAAWIVLVVLINNALKEINSL